MPQDVSPDRRWFRCERCQTKELFVRPEINHRFHLLLVLCTGGLWLVSYISVLIGRHFQPWVCESCSHRQHPPD
jgi:hypothetical protein